MRASPTVGGRDRRNYLVAYNGYDAGLGNRIRVLLSAKSLAELERRTLLYVWPTGPKFGPLVTDLWDFSGGRRISRVTSRLLARRYPYGGADLHWLDDAARDRRVWQVRTGGALHLPPGARSWQEEFRRLRPVPAVQDAVRAFHGAHLAGRPYVGVMIRAHQVSHAETRAASPVEWFVERMQAIRRQDPDVQFFLSCDVPEVQDDVMRRVGGCSAQMDKGPYNSTRAVRASLVDAHLLACSGYLLGPHLSSFIHLAQYLADDVLTLETARTPTPERVDFRSAGVVADPVRPFVRTAAADG